MLFTRQHSQKGQSLIEILIGSAVGVIMIVGAATVIVSSLKSNADAGRVQTGTALAKELLENVRVWSEADWHAIAGLSTSSASHYYLNAASSPFASSTGDETVVLGGISYARFFYVDAVNRAGGNIDATSPSPPAKNDPSTRKATVSVSWGQASTTISAYFTRSRNNILWQTDWSGGAGQDGPITSVNNKFANSTNMDFSSIPGSITIKF